jgi:ubiquinone/menaquinone biosynthesis C-methylase UbiE
VLGGSAGLLCSHCGHTIPLLDTFLDCRSLGVNSNSTIRQWESQYCNTSTPYSAVTDWMRITTWRKHLFQCLPQDLVGKLIVDVGCGTADRVAAIIPINEYAYRYVGVDSSGVALRRAAINMPGSLLIRANLQSLNLHEEIADAVLCLGVLMYFEDASVLLEKLVRLLKPGGFLLLHEAVLPRSLGFILRRLHLIKEVPSPEWRGVCMSKVVSQLEGFGTIIHTHRSGSPLQRFICRIPVSRWFYPLRSVAARFDSIWCETAGRFLKALRPAEFQLVFKKESR